MDKHVYQAKSQNQQRNLQVKQQKNLVNHEQRKNQKHKNTRATKEELLAKLKASHEAKVNGGSDEK